MRFTAENIENAISLIERGIISKREAEILQQLADGAGNKQIAENLVISIETIQTHIKNIKKRLRARNMKHAVALGIRADIIQ